MKIYTVIVMRDIWFLGLFQDIDKMQDLQYVATGVKAEDEKQAGALAIAEVLKCDKKHFKHKFLKPTDYTVLGHFIGGEYRPWFNGDCP